MRKSGVRAWVNYEMTQTTTFSLGESGSTGAGGFKGDGIPSLYKTVWSPGTNCAVTYSVHPSEETGGNHIKFKIAIPRTPMRFCAPEPGGSTWHKSKTTASTISGLTVPEIGFTASAQTGWSSTDTLYYKGVVKHHTYWLCGVKDFPGGAPGRVVAGRP